MKKKPTKPTKSSYDFKKLLAKDIEDRPRTKQLKILKPEFEDAREYLAHVIGHEIENNKTTLSVDNMRANIKKHFGLTISSTALRNYMMTTWPEHWEKHRTGRRG